MTTEDCIEWAGYRHKHGHGQMKWGGKVQYAHRVAWQMAEGPIPEGMIVRHKCDNPPCVNVGHLELGTIADNNRDRIERGRDGQSNKTHCKWGHEFTLENTWWRTGSRKGRECRACWAHRKILKTTE